TGPGPTARCSGSSDARTALWNRTARVGTGAASNPASQFSRQLSNGQRQRLQGESRALRQMGSRKAVQIYERSEPAIAQRKIESICFYQPFREAVVPPRLLETPAASRSGRGHR